MELLDWVQESKKYWLTIKDIKKLKKGDQIKIFLIHRNLYDICCEINEPGKNEQKAEKFFKGNYSTYVHNKELNGHMIFHLYDPYIKNEKKDEKVSPFFWDIEYQENFLFPQNEKGYIPSIHPYTKNKILEKDTHWSEFPEERYIGWRGLSMLASSLEKMPDVYWTKEAFKNSIDENSI